MFYGPVGMLYFCNVYNVTQS